jgi:hypothetical protein
MGMPKAQRCRGFNGENDGKTTYKLMLFHGKSMEIPYKMKVKTLKTHGN